MFIVNIQLIEYNNSVGLHLIPRHRINRIGPIPLVTSLLVCPPVRIVRPRLIKRMVRSISNPVDVPV